MGLYALRKQADSVALAMGGGNRQYGLLLRMIRRRLASRMQRWLALTAVLFLPFVSCPAEGRPDLCDLPIEVLMEMEFIPAARLGTSAPSDAATSAFQTLLAPEMQIRSLVLPNGWGFCLPCFWVVVLDESRSEAVITNESRHISEHMTK